MRDRFVHILSAFVITGGNVALEQESRSRNESQTPDWGETAAAGTGRTSGSRQSNINRGEMRSQLCTSPGDGQGRRHDIPSVCLSGSPCEHRSAASVRQK